MFCTKCGAQIKEGGKFCPKCGAPLKEAPAGEKTSSEPSKPRQTATNRQAETLRPDNADAAAPETSAGKKGIGNLPVIVLLILLIVFVLAGIGGGVYYFLTHTEAQDSHTEDDGDDEEEEEEQAPEDEAEEETEGQSISGEETPQETIEAADEAAEPDAWMDADYILDFSAWREVTEEDLEGLNPEQLRIARNEIYARHGRQFLDEALNQWFYGKEWYRDISEKYAPDEFDSLSPAPLSDLERKNAAFISEYEKKLGETAE